MKKNQKYDITQCALYKCRSQRRLEHLLLIEKYGLKRIQNVISYHSFEIDKKNSTDKRAITAPNKELKKIQKRILTLIQKVYRPEWLISGEKGKCYIDNGKAHLQANFVLTIDIRKFYDNCKREPVFRFFKDQLRMSGDVAGLITDIVTYNQGIPTGCPTSQLIAYYAYFQMFYEIDNIANLYGCKFTLYVDDMTFSSSEIFKYQLLENGIDKILRKYGHRPKYKKVKFFTRRQYKPITGTIVSIDHQIKVPNNLQKKIYDNFQLVKGTVGTKNCSPQCETTLSTLRGQLSAAKNIERNKFPQITHMVSLMPVPESKICSPKKYYNDRSFRAR